MATFTAAIVTGFTQEEVHAMIEQIGMVLFLGPGMLVELGEEDQLDEQAAYQEQEAADEQDGS